MRFQVAGGLDAYVLELAGELGAEPEPAGMGDVDLEFGGERAGCRAGLVRRDGGDDAVVDDAAHVVLVDEGPHRVFVPVGHQQAQAVAAEHLFGGGPPPFLAVGQVDELGGVGEVRGRDLRASGDRFAPLDRPGRKERSGGLHGGEFGQRVPGAGWPLLRPSGQLPGTAAAVAAAAPWPRRVRRGAGLAAR